MEAVIEAGEIRKSYGATLALDGLSLAVNSGEVMGFLGPNGSGKSTMIRILMGLLQADGGTVRLSGRDPWTDAVELHRQIAYVPGDVTLWPTLSGGETIDLLARIGPGLDSGRRADLIERLDFDPTKKGRAYSKGNRQKVGLIAALASRAEVLILDEPTSGLDPLMEVEFQHVVRERVADGATVLLSSHILAEVESLCDHVTIIADGRTVEQGSLTELRHLNTIQITATTDAPLDRMADLDGVSDFIADGDRHASFSVARDAAPTVFAALAQLGVVDLVSETPTLEQLFLRHYQVSPTTSGPSARPTERTGGRGGGSADPAEG